MTNFQQLISAKFQTLRIARPNLETIGFFALNLLVFLVPLFFLPKLVDSFELPKSVFVLAGSLLCLILWLANALASKRLPFAKSIFLFPAGLLAGSAVVSALLTDNKFLSLASDPVLLAGSFLLLILLSQQVKNVKSFQTVVTTLLFSGAVLSLLALVQNLAPNIPALKPLASPFLASTFSPVGSTLSQTIFLIILLPLAVGNYFASRKILPIVLLATIGLGVILGGFTLFQIKPTLLSYSAGWRIATGVLGQSLSSVFFGAGPGNYVDAFTLFRPIEFNTTPFWNLRFTAGANYYFYLLTTLGITGLASFLFLAGKILHLTGKRLESGLASPLEKGLLGSLVAALVLFAFLPMPAVAIATFFALLGLLTAHFKVSENAAYVTVSDVSANYSFVRPAALLASLAAFGFVIWQLGQFVLADYHFAQSLVAAQNNRATDTYNLQIKAISLNPWNDSYRVSYSQTNLALADALAATPNLTDQQKQTVVTLVQQAIREARLAVALAPRRAADWENLSIVYRGLINFAQGADEWAVASQSQAVSFDPANPRLRLDLGGIYFARKDFQNALQVLTTAVTLKPDYANAHYNLAQVLKELKLLDRAREELQLTATLVCATGQTPDCQRVNSEISGLAPAPAAPIASPSATTTNLPKAKTTPPAKISTPAGELAQ